jgi:hypothetical protein
LAEIEQLFFVRSPGLNGATLQPAFAKVDLLESRDNHSSRSQRALETSEQTLPSLASNRVQVPGKSPYRTTAAGRFHLYGIGVNRALAASSPILVGKRRVSEVEQCETGAEFRNPSPRSNT